MVPLFKRIEITFKSFRKIISDNAFNNTVIRIYYKIYGTNVFFITFNRLRGNGKIKKANDFLKRIIYRKF